MMLTAMFMFTTMGICIRLSSAFVPVLEIVFFRNFLALLIMAPVLIRSGAASIRMNRPRLFFGGYRDAIVEAVERLMHAPITQQRN